MRNLFLLLFCSLFYLPAADAADRPATEAKARHQAASEEPLERIETDVIRFQKSTPRIYESLEAMKAAKASYIQELTASPGKARHYRTNKSRRQMVGVYLFDMSYASVFDRKKQAKEAVEAVQQLVKVLGFSDRKVKQQYQKLVKEYETAPLKNLIIDYEKVLNDSLRAIDTTEEGVALISEAAYGWLIEGLYVISEIVAQQNYSPIMLYRINEHAECIKPVVELLKTVRSDPKMSHLVASGKQLALLSVISTTLNAAERISQKEVDAVRAIVSKERAAILK